MPSSVDRKGRTRHAPPMGTLGILAASLGSALAIIALWQILVTPVLRRGPSDDPGITFICHLSELYARGFHGLQVEGQEYLDDAHGPLVVVSNHSSPLDPFLIQASCPSLFIHWMMAQDQMGTGLDDLWESLQIIPTDRFKGDPSAAMAAMRILRRGGVVGVFPEGRLARPAGTLLPFHDGVGALVAHTRAKVLLACVQDTPGTESIPGSFVRPSRSRVSFLDLASFPRGTDATTITRTLRDRILEATAWIDAQAAPPLPAPVDPFLG